MLDEYQLLNESLTRNENYKIKLHINIFMLYDIK